MPDNDELRKRTKDLALRILKVVEALPNNIAARTVAQQLLRSSTSAAANYRAACRGRSKAEFFSKLCIVVEEMDETLFWLEFISEGGLMAEKRLAPLRREALELTSIFSAARHSARSGASR